MQTFLKKIEKFLLFGLCVQNKNDFFAVFVPERSTGKREKEYLTSFTTYGLIKRKNTGAFVRRDAIIFLI